MHCSLFSCSYFILGEAFFAVLWPGCKPLLVFCKQEMAPDRYEVNSVKTSTLTSIKVCHDKIILKWCKNCLKILTLWVKNKSYHQTHPNISSGKCSKLRQLVLAYKLSPLVISRAPCIILKYSKIISQHSLGIKKKVVSFADCYKDYCVVCIF